MKNKHPLRLPIVWALHAMTAKAMGIPFRPGLPALENYARFTRDCAAQIGKDELPAVEEKLYRTAFRAGNCIRKLLFIRTDARARNVLFRLYCNIGIELEGPCPGDIQVRRCYFSKFYTPEICRIMYAMDRGIFAGLFGGGELAFSSRITEGCPCCQAAFSRKQDEV